MFSFQFACVTAIQEESNLRLLLYQRDATDMPIGLLPWPTGLLVSSDVEFYREVDREGQDSVAMTSVNGDETLDVQVWLLALPTLVRN